MGNMAMGKCKDWQKNFYIVQTNFEDYKGGYGRLPLGNVYTCHGFLPKMGKFEKTHSRRERKKKSLSKDVLMEDLVTL